MSSTRRVDWHEWLLVLGFVLSVTLVAVFAARSVRVARQLHQDEPIRPWMTVPYIAYSYRVSSSVLYEALGLSPRPRDRRPLADIARAEDRPVQDLIVELQHAIARARSSPVPSPSPGNAP